MPLFTVHDKQKLSTTDRLLFQLWCNCIGAAWGWLLIFLFCCLLWFCVVCDAVPTPGIQAGRLGLIPFWDRSAVLLLIGEYILCIRLKLFWGWHVWCWCICNNVRPRPMYGGGRRGGGLWSKFSYLYSGHRQRDYSRPMCPIAVKWLRKNKCSRSTRRNCFRACYMI